MIKKPIDFNKITQKIQQGNYESMESMLTDVTHMFDNAMTFNESDSILYKVSAYHFLFSIVAFAAMVTEGIAMSDWLIVGCLCAAERVLEAIRLPR